MQELYEGQDQLGDLTVSLQSSCKKFIALLRLKYKEDECELPQVACLLVFDEAQELAALLPKNGDSEERSYFHYFGSVLKELVPYNHAVFSVFLSTNSNVQFLAPPSIQLHPSLREVPEPEPGQSHPPITELPFDVFAKDLNDNLSITGKSMLSETCSVGVMARFGRTM